MRFSKLQATGNDFILIDARAMEDKNWTELARAMCDRHFGVGADGLMLVCNSDIADLKMRLFNSDGSEAEVSGNGLRCFAKFAIERCLSQGRSAGWQPGNHLLSVETLSGIRTVKTHTSGNKIVSAEVNMGPPRFLPEQIPVKVKADAVPISSYPLVVDGQELSLFLLSMGNPHAVCFVSQPVADFPLTSVGPKVENHSIFPQRTNFEVARVLNKRMVEARVWERGVGETMGCGSGACAIAVAGQLLKRVGSKVDIILPGGTLTVCWDGVADVLLTGPVEEVFTGEWLGRLSNETSEKT